MPDDAVLVADGGLATELEASGNDVSGALWSARLLMDAPEEIRDVHLAFFRAGAVIATSASHQASFEGFARAGLGRREAAGLMRRSVDLARAARDGMAVDGRTRAGQSLSEAFAVAAGVPEVVAVGVNCCAPSEVPTAIAAAREVTGKPVIVYPNSGEEWDARRRAWTGRSRYSAAEPRQWIAAGAKIAGGCCRVRPADIAVISPGGSQRWRGARQLRNMLLPFRTR